MAGAPATACPSVAVSSPAVVGAPAVVGPQAAVGAPIADRAPTRPTSGIRDRRLAQLAADQNGLVTRRQLLDAGFTARAIERLVQRGALSIELRGVYAVGYPVEDLRRRLRACLLACGPDARLSHETAANWLGLGPAPELTAPVHVTVVGPRRRVRSGLVVHRAARLAADDRTVARGLPTTSMARTLVDVASTFDERRLERMVHTALVDGGLAPASLLAAIDRAPGRRTGLLRELASASAGGRRSGLEHDLWRHLGAAGLTDGARCNLSIGPWEVDVAWPDAQVVVEADGFRYHRTRADRERDERKTRWFRARGYDLLRFSDREIDQRPLAVVAEIAGALAVARQRRTT